MPSIRNHRSHHPAVESLDGRLLLTAGPAPLSYLLTPISDTAPLAEHIHPRLEIIIEGHKVRIPAEIGISSDGADPIHTHDASGKLHVEATVPYDFTLGNFFTIWGKDFSSQDILGHHADAMHQITMTVDGRPSDAFESLVLQDHQHGSVIEPQHIVIREVAIPTHDLHANHARG